MPTGLSSQQQAQLNAANTALSIAKSELDSATTNANNALASLNRCHCGKGKNNGQCAPLKTQVVFPNLASITSCQSPAPFDKCQTDCCNKDTCINKVNAYNASIDSYNSAMTKFNTAKDNLQSVIDAIAKDPTIAGATAENIASIQGESSAKYIKWLLFGLISLAIIIGAVMMSRKVATA